MNIFLGSIFAVMACIGLIFLAQEFFRIYDDKLPMLFIISIFVVTIVNLVVSIFYFLN